MKWKRERGGGWGLISVFAVPHRGTVQARSSKLCNYDNLSRIGFTCSNQSLTHVPWPGSMVNREFEVSEESCTSPPVMDVTRVRVRVCSSRYSLWLNKVSGGDKCTLMKTMLPLCINVLPSLPVPTGAATPGLLLNPHTKTREGRR